MPLPPSSSEVSSDKKKSALTELVERLEAMAPQILELIVEKHICQGTSDDLVCEDGDIYGPCGSEYCYGGCEKYYLCECPCHEEKESNAEGN